MSIGLLAMVMLFVIAIGAYRGPGPEFDPVPPGAAAAPPIPERASSAGREAASPPAPAVPGLSPRKTDPPSEAGTPSPVPSRPGPATPEPPPVASAPPRSSAPPAAKPAPLEARYRVMDTFQGGFIAEVLIRNTSRGDLEWVARVEYAGGRVVTAWLEGVPQGTFTGRRGTLTYRSGPDLSAGASVALRFHIEYADSSPRSCSVSGRACSRR
ncbi:MULTISPECIES: cellulose binding domain-containing protein [unclassified Micromonospora]|uniref:cellulose binding domain-containing protein n=1 Tax=unclassified Micromonospora TaxID=2617518 RepID=UPI0015903411|nr:cellulose binding domain-containing protein [Verrucosispora sp. NA02020]QKW15239.1 cellulose binding domain-containing protein [Verrucosispora sp. NA02020]